VLEAVEAEEIAVASLQLEVEVDVGFAVIGANEGGGCVVLLELYPQLGIGLSCESSCGMEGMAAVGDGKVP